ncbi:MAG: hypothetical protein AAB250_04915, partial [Bdellovibrionota bacterium]
MKKFTSALAAVALLFSTAIVSNSCAWNSKNSGVQFSETDLHALRSGAPDRVVGVIALTESNDAKEFAKLAGQAGGEIRAVSEKAGVVVAEFTANEALALSEMPRALSLATYLALEQNLEFDFSKERLDPETGVEHDPTAVVIDRRPENAQLPTHEMGVLDFERDIKTRFGVEPNGETVKVAIVDTGLDLAHTDVFQDRVRVSWDMTKEGRIKASPASFDSVTTTVSTKGAEASAPKLVVSSQMLSPTNEYFLGKL